MQFAPGSGEFDLSLSLAHSGAVCITQAFMAIGAAFARDVQFRLFLFLRKGHPACVTHVVVATLKIVIDRHSIVEYKTLTFPERVFLLDNLEILQDASLQVKNFFKTLHFQE